MECGQPPDAPKEVTKIDCSTPHSYTPKHLADKILTTRREPMKRVLLLINKS